MERRTLLGKHLGDLPLRRAVDARVGPVHLPAIEIRLRLIKRLETLALQRRLLRVPDARFDLAFAVGIPHPTRQPDDAVVREDVAIERIEERLVDVRREHALFEVVEDHDLDGAAQAPEGPLVQLGPGLRARLPDQEPHSFPRVAQRQDEEPRPPVLARLRMADHRPVAVVDLGLFARRGRDDDASLGGRRAAQVEDKAPDTGVPGGEAVLDQVLPDRHRIAPEFQCGVDAIAMRLTRARLRGTRRRGRPRCRRSVGGHLPGNGRFSLSFAWSPSSTGGDAGRF